MSEKRQIATIWVLTVLIVILISIMVGLFITVAKAKRQRNIERAQQVVQTQQELTIAGERK